MPEKVRTYESPAIRIVYDPVRCIHAAECVRGLSAVFDPDQRPWIDPSKAAADDIAAVISRCPTGALAYERLEAAARPEPTPSANLVTVSADGPLFLRGRVIVKRADGTTGEELRLALCRCGASTNKPLCDGGHHARGFTDPGAVVRRGASGFAPDGALEVTPQTNGPTLVRGHFTLVDGRGADRGVFEKAAFCRCGASNTKPFCDGSHVAVGFVAD
jgi:CDGSH-type Zn-finger protein/uncharacterized Fe-S cluster protein YjdI